jgi:hypothetical protein
MNLTRIDNDTYGNPRYVCHFSSIASESDREEAQKYGINYISILYQIVVKKANRIGGRKYHTKKYGGGIVFQSYNTDELRKQLLELSNS